LCLQKSNTISSYNVSVIGYNFEVIIILIIITLSTNFIGYTNNSFNCILLKY